LTVTKIFLYVSILYFLATLSVGIVSPRDHRLINAKMIDKSDFKTTVLPTETEVKSIITQKLK